MYFQNSFHSVKLSEEKGYPCTLSMNVYLNRKDLEEGKQQFVIRLEPDDLNAGYNIKDDREHYRLLIDDKEIDLL